MGLDVNCAENLAFQEERFTVAALRELSQVKQTCKECSEILQVLLTGEGHGSGSL